MAKKKAASKKKPAAKKAAKKAAPKKAVKKKAAPKRTAAKTPPHKKKTVSRAHARLTAPSIRPQPLPPGSEQLLQFAGGDAEEDEHGPMHIPSHKPAPAYAEMHKRDWAGQPPRHDIPIPKR